MFLNSKSLIFLFLQSVGLHACKKCIIWPVKYEKGLSDQTMCCLTHVIVPRTSLRCSISEVSVQKKRVSRIVFETQPKGERSFRAWLTLRDSLDKAWQLFLVSSTLGRDVGSLWVLRLNDQVSSYSWADGGQPLSWAQNKTQTHASGPIALCCPTPKWERLPTSIGKALWGQLFAPLLSSSVPLLSGAVWKSLSKWKLVRSVLTPT